MLNLVQHLQKIKDIRDPKTRFRVTDLERLRDPFHFDWSL